MACSYGYEGGPKIPRKVTESMQRSARRLKESGSNGLRGKNQKGQLLAMNSDGTKGANGDGGDYHPSKQ